ncbi:MAG TPA: cytochrome C oxidase subunit IV family protein [Fluviicola sp.]|nr:cytochrome C oxidase subunit IV family protein [Fluviicola sp.]
MERDDIIEYSLHNHHSDEEGKKIRKKIWVVTGILTLITIVEVMVGLYFGRSMTFGATWESIKWGYVVLTLIKAGYIVLVFMHLGDEKKILKQTVLISYLILAIYLIFILLFEGTAVNDAWNTYGG